MCTLYEAFGLYRFSVRHVRQLETTTMLHINEYTRSTTLYLKMEQHVQPAQGRSHLLISK